MMNMKFVKPDAAIALIKASFVLITLLCGIPLHAQLDVQSDLTIEEYVNDVLLGEGVTAFNVTYTGGMDQLGKLVNGDDSDYAFDQGLVMSTENSKGIGCSFAGCSDCLGDAVTDSSLLSVANEVPALIGEAFEVESVVDVSILEFDFFVTGDSIGFDYIFGSDEYDAWINTPYNDVFGFFLSGPGIEGAFDSPANFPNGAINIAGVPGTDPNLPITVSSVNSNLNSAYFVPNLPYDGICINGYTSVFHAGHPVQCGEIYHIKLAIADGTDSGVESVVILEQGSFVSNVPVEVTSSLDIGEEGDNLIFEGCGTVEWLFERPADSNLDSLYAVLLDFDQGEAENGVDFGRLLASGEVVPFEDTIVFEPGVSALEYTLLALNDEEDEGVEPLIATLSALESCLDGFVYIAYDLSDGPDPIEIDGFNTLACSNVQIVVQPEVSGGFGNYSYAWSCSTSNNPTLMVATDEDWSCLLTVSDTCGLQPGTAVNSITLLDPIPLSVDLQPDSVEIIPGDTVPTFAIIEGGLSFGGLYSTAWYINGELVQSGFDTLLVTVPELYDEIIIEAEDACGNEVQDELLIDAFYVVDAVITALDSSMMGPDTLGYYACKGVELLWSNEASTATNDSVLSYQWNWGDGTVEYSMADTVSHEWNEPGIYEVTLSMAGPYDAFDVSEPFFVTVFPQPNVQFLVDSPVCLGGVGEAEVSAYPGQFLQTVAYAGGDEQLVDTVPFVYEFTLEVEGFSDEAVIDTCTDLRKIRAELEHSYVGALDIWVSCPDGSELVLMQNNQDDDDCNGSTDVDEANLGEPVIGVGNDTAGVGYTYTWRPNGFYLLDDSNNSALDGGTINPGSYTSCDDWCELEGCPVNGEWTLHIATEDSLGDGHFFGWNFQFEHHELDELGLNASAELDVTNGGFDWNSLPESATIVEDSLGFQATYDAFAVGSHFVNFVALDGYGCSINKFRSVIVNDGLGFAVDGGPNPNACASAINLTANLVNTDYTECPGMPYGGSWCIGNEVDTVFTICPLIQGDGSYMHLNLPNAQLDSLGDYLIVYDGPDATYPILGTYTGDLANIEWGAEDASGCLTLRFITNEEGSCEDGFYPPIDFVIDCNPFFLDVLWQWTPGEFVIDSLAQNTQAIDGAEVTEYVVSAFLEGQPTCVSTDTLKVLTQLNAEWLALQADCDISNGTLVIDVDAPGVAVQDWLVQLNPSDSTQSTISAFSNGDPMAFEFLPNDVYGVNISNDNCSFDTEIELNSEDDNSALPCGCTYPIFDNYDATAVVDDGSCVFIGGGGGGGCDYESWCEEYYANDCPADLNENGFIEVGDLLELMSIFGSYCPGEN